MPWATDKQRRWGNSPTGKAKLGTKVVNEFNQASKGMKLPETTEECPKEEASEPKSEAMMEGDIPKTRFTHMMKR